MVASPSLIPGDTGEADTEGGVHEAPFFYFYFATCRYWPALNDD